MLANKVFIVMVDLLEAEGDGERDAARCAYLRGDLGCVDQVGALLHFPSRRRSL